MNKQETFICLRDTLAQDKQMALDKLIVRFGIEDVFQRVVGKGEVNTVCYPCPDTYIEVAFLDDGLRRLSVDMEYLDDMKSELQEITGYALRLTSHPSIMDNGVAVYQVGCRVMFPLNNAKKDGDEKEDGRLYEDYLAAVKKGNNS